MKTKKVEKITTTLKDRIGHPLKSISKTAWTPGVNLKLSRHRQCVLKLLFR